MLVAAFAVAAIARAVPAAAAVPGDSVIVLRAGTVEQQALPSLLALSGTSVSALELEQAFALGVWFDSDDVLAYTVGGGPPLVVDPTRFVPPAARADYYDPAFMATRPATVVEATAGGTEASFEVGDGAQTLTDLLAPDGSLLVFAAPVPEPGGALGLSLGGAWLAMLGRRRRPRT